MEQKQLIRPFPTRNKEGEVIEVKIIFDDCIEIVFRRNDKGKLIVTSRIDWTGSNPSLAYIPDCYKDKVWATVYSIFEQSDRKAKREKYQLSLAFPDCQKKGGNK